MRFVPMVRDASRLKIVRDQVQTLRRARVDAAALVATPEPLNETALYRRGPGPGGEVLPTRADAAAVVAALRRGGFLDDQGYLLEDPRRSDWRSVVRPVVTTDSLVAHASPISEILNVAWAEHESLRRADIPGHGTTAAATWTFRGDESRRRRAATRTFRGDKSRRHRGCDVDIPWRTSRGAAAAAT